MEAMEPCNREEVCRLVIGGVSGGAIKAANADLLFQSPRPLTRIHLLTFEGILYRRKARTGLQGAQHS